MTAMKTSRRKHRILLTVIALFVTLAMVPQFGEGVHGQAKISEYIGPEQLGVDVNTTSAKVVSIGGKSWRVIGYDGQGVACEKGEIVLFADEFLTTCPYNDVDDEYDRKALTYKGSTLQKTLDNYYNENFTAGEKQSIIPRQLEAMEIAEYQDGDEDWWDKNFYTVDKVPYEGVNDAALWPLSAKEAYMEVERVVRSTHTGYDAYWLRTLGCVEWLELGEPDCWYPPVMAIVETDGTVTMQGMEEDITYPHGVRPALKLKLDNIAFACRPISDAQVDWKLTLKDDAHKNFYVTDCDNTLDSNGDLVIKYRDAVPGDNEYISYIIEGSDKRITKYERLGKVTSTTGTATITGLPKDASGKISLKEGDKLYVFNEQDNGDKTDFSSNLMEIGTEATGHDWGFDDFGWGYRPGPKEHYAWASYNCRKHKEHWKTIDAKLEPWDNTPKCDETVIPKYTASVTAEEAPDGVARERIFWDNSIDPIGHNWQFDNFEWTGSEEDGYTAATGKYTCLNDSSHKKQAKAEITQEVTDPNCTTAGKTTYTASIPYFDSPDEKNHKETKDAKHIKALGHTWDAGKVTKTATEKQAGTKTFTCTVCKATKTETIPKLKPSAPKISGTPLAKVTAKGKTGFTISWNKIQGAAGYDIFFARCNHDSKKIVTKKVKTIKGNKTFKWTKSGLKKGIAYKAYVKAYVMQDGRKKYVKTSPLMHAYTGNGTKNYTNAKSVTVNKTKVTLKKGKTFKIKAKVNKVNKKKKLMSKSHAPNLRYMTSNKKVATVNSSGKITAKSKGTCTVYVFAHNGVSKQIKVTVK